MNMSKRLLSLIVGVTAVAALTACSTLTPASSSGVPPLNRLEITQLLSSSTRSESDRQTDARRQPDRLLAFIGVAPAMRVLDLSAGGGYTTELLARAVGPAGRVYGQSAPRNPDVTPPAAPEGGAATPGSDVATGFSIGPANPSASRMSSPDALRQRSTRASLANIEAVVRPFEDPVPDAARARGLDLVTLMYNYHDLGHQGVDRDKMNRVVWSALKPGGVYVIADHAGRPGTGISESGTLHRVEEAFVRREVEAAGFRFVAAGDFLRNPADPRDLNVPEGGQRKDEFILKFVKP